MKIAILGYGAQGHSAYAYWDKPGNELTICDANEKLEVPAGAHTKLGPRYLQQLDGFDVIVRSPGVHPRDIVVANTPAILHKVTSVTNEFLRVCPTKHIIAVTGTKGKGTTSTMIARMLEAAGKTVHFGGNIGIPPLDLLQENIQPSDWVVLELANFQLVDLRHSPHIAVCLMVVPEHLNWHEDMEDYARAKAQLFAHQSPKDIAIYYADNEISHQIASASPGAKIAYYAEPGAYVHEDKIVIDNQTICRVDELKLLGKHNWQNACAAATAVWQVVQDVAPIRDTLSTFSGLPHRLEFVREVDGVQYYNDSFAATPDAAIAAMEAIPGHKVIIMGGFDRNLPLDHVGEAAIRHQNELRKIVLIGAGGPRLAAVLDEKGFSSYQFFPFRTMAEIVHVARGLAQKGDAVVLSPGFTSFDMFKNFEERGLQFKAAVSQL